MFFVLSRVWDREKNSKSSWEIEPQTGFRQNINGSTRPAGSKVPQRFGSLRKIYQIAQIRHLEHRNDNTQQVR